MNEFKFKRYHIIGAIFVIMVGMLMHFVYGWSDDNKLVAIFGSINESTWEHLKLLFWPMLAFNIVEYFIYGRSLKNFIPVKVMSILFGILTIIVLFYTYTGIIGKNYLVLDILTFIIAVAAAFALSYHNLKIQKKYTSQSANSSGIILLFILIVCFVIFTYNQPHIGLFYDPSLGLYGYHK